MTFGMTLVFGYVLQGAVRNLSLVFYFMLFKSWSHERFTELHYSIAESIVIFFSGHHPFWQSSSAFEQENVFLSAKS
jgi:hypothetical protein